MSAIFRADPAFDAGSVVLMDWPLCQVRLQDDARFPWVILIPRRAGLSELEALDVPDRTRLMDEIVRAGEIVRMIGQAAKRPIHKLNVAALGNVTSQLHVHVVGRRHDDDCWPDPVWAKGVAMPYGAEDLMAVAARVRLNSVG